MYIASHVVVSGFCSIGDYCFMGVNAAVADEVTIGNNCLIGMGANVTKNLDNYKVCVSPRASIIDYENMSTKARGLYDPMYEE